MSFETRFTEDERQLLAATPILIGSAMAFAESSGLATVKELLASATAYVGGLKSYPQNEIIQGILPNLEERTESMARTKEFRQKTIARLKEEGIDSQEKVRALLLADSRAINDLLTQKADSVEAAEYKRWAMSVAENVARAAKEGGFLGFGGERVSAGEKDLFTELAAALDTDSQLA